MSTKTVENNPHNFFMYNNKPVRYRNKFVAAILAFFLGTYGVHKFYLREIAWGIIYFLFNWSGIPAIYSFIETIIFVVAPDDYFDKRFNKPDGSPPNFNWLHFAIFIFLVAASVLIQILVFGGLFIFVLLSALWAIMTGTGHSAGTITTGY